jgi:hypothetical protein
MSYDLSTKLSSCDHAQSFERYVVDVGDFRTLHLASNVVLNMRAPINGASLVRLYVRGQLVQIDDPIYGYTISPDTNRIQTSDQFYKIVFNKPVRSYIPLIEVSYLTLKNYCLKCSTTGQLNDFKGVSNGSVLHVIGTNKLIQKVLKMILTSKCSFYPQFTSKLKTFIGRKFGVSVTDADVSNEVINSLQSLKKIQAAQRTVQSLDPQEMLKDVNNLQTVQVDPNSIAVSGVLTSYGSPNGVPFSFSLTTASQLVGN